MRTGLIWAGLAALLVRASPLAAGEVAKRIAVVNVARVFNAYERVKDVETKMKADFEPKKNDLEAKGRKLQDDMEAHRRNANTLDPRVVFTQKQELERQAFNLEVEKRELEVKLEVKRLDEMRQVLRDIRNAIRHIGQTGGYDLIFRAPEYDEEGKFLGQAGKGEQDNEAKNASELVRRFRENPVLHFHESVDVTQKVIEKLSQDYQAMKAAPQPK